MPLRAINCAVGNNCHWYHTPGRAQQPFDAIEVYMVKQRFLALDVMRGLTLALMILVNTPGSWSHVYGPLLHADWHGVTPTDFVFPFFLFIVGSAMYFSVRGLAQLSLSQQLRKVGRRVLLLFVMGILLAAYPFTADVHDWRIMGVLQRIALAYGVAALIVLYAGFNARLLMAAGLLLGYWILLALAGSDPYSLEHNLVRQLDITLLGESHLWQGKGLAFDPEGLLSTLPAVVNVLAGFEATRVLLASDNKPQAIRTLLIAALGLVLLALLWNLWMPINKSLWTSPFVLLTSGIAIAFLMLLIRLEQVTSPLVSSWLQPLYQGFAIIGKNPLFIYCLSFVWATSMYLIPVGDTTLYGAIYEFFKRFADPYLASLLFALLQVAIFWFIAWVLHKRNIVISL
ncbi:putative membrane protein [Cellvibrio japonicus Ueda107]|uniref:Putative membrane protein n=2 Tax=Cellvibrio japonicus TaxID=155077 RepID=B3PBU8_CELJU|nr:putative membrane protein [Cellvibrio japonicus Ueda107]